MSGKSKSKKLEVKPADSKSSLYKETVLGKSLNETLIEHQCPVKDFEIFFTLIDENLHRAFDKTKNKASFKGKLGWYRFFEQTWNFSLYGVDFNCPDQSKYDLSNLSITSKDFKSEQEKWKKPTTTTTPSAGSKGEGKD
ncbi:hypothetical protein SNEBB_006876 [Seison nebaliae]|nr:hypothetical protein SNEBB_006876 [Seison nebaliae]